MLLILKTEAACLTCRKKSRRCDRARPMCKRCVSKGLECGGYPDKFRFCGIASRGKWKNQSTPADQTEVVSDGQVNDQLHKSPADSSTPGGNGDVSSQSPAGSAKSEIEKILASVEGGALLSHCIHPFCLFLLLQDG